MDLDEFERSHLRHAAAEYIAALEARVRELESEPGAHWVKKQLGEAHALLTEMGVPDREARPDYNRGTMQIENNQFSLGIPERIRWLRHHWRKPT